ncbi:MAG: hypothetical protein Q9M45_04335 [Robiginitomaculum sp.]|nr:hypothetical protein [Robiginitomaculum sp.]
MRPRLFRIAAKLRPEPWQLKYLFKISSYSWLVHIVVVLLVFIAIRPRGDFFLYWLIAMLVASIFMTCVSRYGAALDLQSQSQKLLNLGTVHTNLTIIVGILWGAGAIATTRLSLDNTQFFPWH